MKHYDLNAFVGPLLEREADEAIDRIRRKLPDGVGERAFSLDDRDYDDLDHLLDMASNFHTLLKYAQDMQFGLKKAKKIVASKGRGRSDKRHIEALTAAGVGNSTDEVRERVERAWSDFELLTKIKKGVRFHQLRRVELYREKDGLLEPNRVRARVIIELAARHGFGDGITLHQQFSGSLRKQVGVSKQTIENESELFIPRSQD